MNGSMQVAIYQGTDWLAEAIFSDAETGMPADLTGYTARAQIRRKHADAEPVVAAEIAVAFELPDRLMLSLDHDATKLLNGRYVWDLDLIAPDGTITTPMAGPVVVTPEVTREVAGG
jgi:hypothetical protein